MGSTGGPTSGAVKVLALRRAGVCGCGAHLPVGTRAGWDRVLRAVVCMDCLDEGLRLRVSGPEASTVRVPGAPEPRVAVEGPAGVLPAPQSPMKPLPSVVDAGDPGSSLQAEYERRSTAREARARARFPRIGGFLLAVTKEPASTTAFSKGAAGERRVALRLAELAGPGVLFLHNRLLGPGRRDGDVDHIALTAGGVYVIDAKRYKNAKIEVRRSGGLFSPVREQLMVNGRDRSKLLDSVARQSEAVRTAMRTFHHVGATAADIPVVSVMCFVDAVLPMFGTPRIGGVPLLGPKGTAKLLREATGSLDENALAALHVHLAQALPTARGRTIENRPR
jgi:hypothetical protein